MVLILFLLFIFTVLLGRMFLHYRRTGDYGIRLASKKSPRAQIIASALLALSEIVIFLYTLGLATGYFTLGYQPHLVQLFFGYIFYSLGLLIVLVAQHQMGNSWRFGVDQNEKTTLITEGLFKYTRNPIYVGVFIGSAGFWMLAPTFILFLGLLLGYLAIELFVRKVEEPYLHKQFGLEYKTWKHSTPRYFPRLIK